MKKLILSASLLITAQAFSQQVQTFIFGGVQGNTAKYHINGYKQNTSFKIGGQAGIGMKLPVEGRLSFVPLFFYSLKGYKVEFDQTSPFPDSTAINNSTTIHCVELSALLQHDFNTSPDHFFFRLGPSLDFQLAGHEVMETNKNTVIDRPMTFGFTDYGIYSANMLAHFGYEKGNNFFIYAQYTLGLASINNFDEGPHIHHRNIGLSAGFYLKKKK
ncbi:MAG: PorT family protein [Bacteroidetes bacterium]|nr:MAG: PorT family protein [Bacteroidota bacterium]